MDYCIRGMTVPLLLLSGEIHAYTRIFVSLFLSVCNWLIKSQRKCVYSQGTISLQTHSRYLYLLTSIQIWIVYWCTQRGDWAGLQTGKKKTDCNSKSNLTQRSRVKKKKKKHVIQMEQLDQNPERGILITELRKMQKCLCVFHLLTSDHFISFSNSQQHSAVRDRRSVLPLQYGVDLFQISMHVLREYTNTLLGRKIASQTRKDLLLVN